jgi:phosphoserine phosphatase
MRGEIAFEPALRERVALLKGLPLDVVRRVLATRITLTPGAKTLVATMRAAGAHAVLVSGGFTLFAGDIAARLGFHEHRANRLVSQDGILTGLVAEPVLGRTAKEAALDELVETLGLGAADTLALGDGANDAGMIEKAGLGVAYRGKPALRAVADAVIDHADLSGLLFLQGYRREEFVVVQM